MLKIEWLHRDCQSVSKRAINSLFNPAEIWDTHWQLWPAVNHYYRGGQRPWMRECHVSPGERHQENGAWQSVCEWHILLSMCSMCMNGFMGAWMNTYVPALSEWVVHSNIVRDCRAFVKYTCMCSMSSLDLSVRWCSCVSFFNPCVWPCIPKPASVFKWWQTSSACLRYLTSLAFSSWMLLRGCGILPGQGIICWKPHNTNIYVCCIEREFFRNMIKGSLNRTGYYV